jgi:iron complex transport system ATP-binding protein
LLGGARRPTRGRVTLAGADIAGYSARERARRIAVVSQHVHSSLSFTVAHLVVMGRAPYMRVLGIPSRQDRLAVERAMGVTETEHLASRRFGELSGGEKQRVALAMALAQEADFLLLDEPTVHLDLHHQRELLETLRRLRSERGVGIVAVMHDLNLAALYFDRLVLLNDGRLVADGAPQSVITGPDFGCVFRAPFSLVTHPQRGVPQVLLHRDA